MNKEIDVTIIIPVCHGGYFLKKTLYSVRSLIYPQNRLEVLIAAAKDDIESHETVGNEAALSECDMFLIPCTVPSRSAMLNTACAAARGRILAFTDDDCILFPDWLVKIDTALRSHPDIGILGGTDIHENSASSFNLALDYIFNSFAGTGGLRQRTGLRVGKYYPKLWNMAVPRNIALQVSGGARDSVQQTFNESLSVHEDVDLADRIEKSGKQIAFAPEITVMHSRDTTLTRFAKRNFMMARIARSLDIHRLPHALLMLFALSLCAMMLVSIFYQPVKIPLLIVLGAYLTVLLISAAGGLRQTGRLFVGAYIPVLLILLHFARGFGFMFPWSRRNRKPKRSDLPVEGDPLSPHDAGRLQKSSEAGFPPDGESPDRGGERVERGCAHTVGSAGPSLYAPVHWPH